MAIHEEVRKATARLAEKAEPFTRIDAVNEASRGKGWSTAMFKQARDQAHNVLAESYRKGVLHRYGPVELPSPYKGKFDYVRAAAEIVYGGPLAVDPLTTPNGTFGPLAMKNDTVASRGRRPGATRDDFKPWAEQELGKLREMTEPAAAAIERPKGPPVDTAPFEKRIRDLEQQLQREQKERTALQQLLRERQGQPPQPQPQPQPQQVALPITASRNELAKVLAALGLVSKADLEVLRAQIAQLREAMKAMGNGGGEMDEAKLKELIKDTLAEALIG